MTKSPWQLIILDRDGVINYDSDDYVKSVDEWQALPGSLEAIAEINKLEIPVVIATNQSGVARGLFTIDDLRAMHTKLQVELARHQGYLNHIYYCAHHPDDNCACRKPKPGMYLQAMKDFNADPKHTLVIGDSLRDLEAADAAGCQSVLVKTGKGERTLAKHPELKAEVFVDLADAVSKKLS